MSTFRERIVDAAAKLDVFKGTSEEIKKFIADYRYTFEDMFDSLANGELMTFQQTVLAFIDHPAFDHLFDTVCDSRPDIADSARFEALRCASTISRRGSTPNHESISEVFFIPVTGQLSHIRNLLSNSAFSESLKSAFVDSGVTFEGSYIDFAPVIISPFAASKASPHLLRSVSQAFLDRFNSGDNVSSEVALATELTRLNRTTGLNSPINQHGVSTVLMACFYEREYDLSGELVVDPLTQQLAMMDTDTNDVIAIETFQQLSNEGHQVKIGLPHWLGRACSAAAVQSIQTALENEAVALGFDLPEFGFDGIAFTETGNQFVVEAELDGTTIGPVMVPSQLGGYDKHHLVAYTAALGRTFLPTGQLENNRSFMLN